MSNLDTGLKNPFRWYTHEQHADYRKAWTKNKLKAFNLITPADRLLPFQVIKANGSDPYGIATLELQRASDNATIIPNLAQYIDPTDYKVFTLRDAEYIVYYGNKPFLNGFKIPEGEYFAGLSAVRNGWKSEVFKVVDFDVDNQQCYTEVEYCNCSSLGNILYGNDFGYKNRLYLEAAITKPEYKTEEEGFEDGDKIFHATFKNQTKVYKMKLPLPEYMVDALALLQLHDVIIIRSPFKEDAKIRDFKIDPKWDKDGAYADCELEFRELVIVKENCCKGTDLKAGYIEQFTQVVKGVIVQGDYEWWTGGLWSITNPQQLQNGDLVLMFDDHTRTSGGVYEATRDPNNILYPMSYTFKSAYQQEGQVVYTERENRYYLFAGAPVNIWSDRPVIKSKTLVSSSGLYRKYNIKGVCFKNSFSELLQAPVQFTLPGQPPAPLVFTQSPTPLLLDHVVLNTGHVTPFNFAYLKYKITSKRHNLYFGESDYV